MTSGHSYTTITMTGRDLCFVVIVCTCRVIILIVSLKQARHSQNFLTQHSPPFNKLLDRRWNLWEKSHKYVTFFCLKLQLKYPRNVYCVMTFMTCPNCCPNFFPISCPTSCLVFCPISWLVFLLIVLCEFRLDMLSRQIRF